MCVCVWCGVSEGNSASARDGSGLAADAELVASRFSPPFFYMVSEMKA